MAIGNSSDPYVTKGQLALTQRMGTGNSFPPDVYNQPVWFTINLREYVSVTSTVLAQSSFFSIPGLSGAYFNLPMPVSGLNDSFAIDYNQTETGAIGGVGASVMDALQNPFSVVGNALSGAATIARGLGQSAAGALGDVIGQGAQARAVAGLALGAIANPNLAAVFKGVNLRRHTFTWKLMAYDKAESDMIKNIITGLKKGALPKKELNGNFSLLYPKVAYLFINGNRKNNLVTFSEKGMFIENITANYMGQNGHPAFFSGSQDPVEVDLTITFLERSIVTDEDVGE